MTDTTGALPSVNEPVVDRYRRWTPIWYPWIKRILDTVKSQAGSIFTIEQQIDEVNGRWGVAISENGRVTGAILLDGSETKSTFAVLADKFVVVHPSVDGTTLQAFVIGNVNGTSTVGINGNLIVDDTILARHLDVSSLSAITANMGIVTAGLIQSTNGNSYWNLTTGEFVIGAP
jgi:hypothetical protein